MMVGIDILGSDLEVTSEEEVWEAMPYLVMKERRHGKKRDF